VKSRDLIEALFALLGVYEVIQGLAFAGFCIPFGAAAQEGDSWPSLSTSIGAVVPLVLGTGLIATPRSLRCAPPNESGAPPRGSSLVRLPPT